MNTTQSLTNLEIAKLLRKVAAAYTITGENRFKVIAYDNAATSVEHATSELSSLFKDGELGSVPGLGASIQAHLAELFETGKSKHFEDVLGKVNPAVFPLLEVPGIGPKKAQKLVDSLKIKDESRVVELLEQAAKAGKIADIETFGEKSQSEILENIERYRKGAIKEKRMALPQADLIASEIVDYLRKTCPEAKRIDRLGSLRREVATIGDLDFAVATDSFEKIIEAFDKYPKAVSLVERGPTGASILLAAGRQADLRVGKPEEYGAMLQYFTGSKYHNIRLRDYAIKKGWTLNEYGISNIAEQKSKSKSEEKRNKVHTFADEEKLYNFLGLDYIPPELREDQGEIEAALTHKLPHLVTLSDIKGDLHTHSDYDLQPSHDYGVDSMPEMLLAAKKLGYVYFGFAEHNPKTSGLTDAQIVNILKTRSEKIEHLKASTKSVQIITLLEVDIQPSGDLACPREGFVFLDAAIVSVHSTFGLDKTNMTKRVIRALNVPQAKILGHPTGRLLGEREGFELDWPEIFKICRDLDKALEINSHPSRLDLSDTLVHEAVRAGVKLVINTDSHNKEDLVNMKYGVSVARRGWAEPENIVNTWSYSRLINWLKKR